MAKVTTAKAINLPQLDQELGSQGLVMNDSDLTAVIVATADQSTVIQAELEAGIAAHVAVPYVDPNAAIKASIGSKMSSPTYQPLNAQEVAFLAKAIS